MTTDNEYDGEDQDETCERCGDHPYDEKCLDEYVGDELRPTQTKLTKMLNDERLPHSVRGKIVEAVNALGEAMQAADDYTETKINNVKEVAR